MFGRQVSGCNQPRRGQAALSTEHAVRLDEIVKALFRRDAGEVADGVRIAALTRAHREVVRVHAEPGHAHLGGRNRQVVAHEARVVVADGGEPIDGGDLRPNQVERFGLVRLGHSLEEEILTLEGHDNRASEGTAKRRGQRNQKRVGNVDHVGFRLVGDPRQQLLDLLSLMPVLTAKGRDGQRPSSPGSTAIDPLVKALITAWRVPQPIQGPGRVTEQGNVLLEKHADAAEEHAFLAADVGLVGQGRSVEGQQRDIVSPPDQLRRQRVVAKAAAAIHRRGAGG